MRKGDRLVLRHGLDLASRREDGAYEVGVNYSGLAGDVTVGDRILVDSGLIQMRIPDIQLGIELDVDFFALSFVRAAGDVGQLRRTLEAAGSGAAVISKIEDRQGIRNLDSIIEASDAIMVARGDLGIECPCEQIPILQKFGTPSPPCGNRVWARRDNPWL